MKTNVMRILEKSGIDYVEKTHSHPVFTSEDAATERGVNLSQIVKTMLLKSEKYGYIIALVPGDRKLDFKQLKKVIDDKQLVFVARDNIKQLTGYPPGAVSPIGIKQKCPIFFDDKLLLEEYVTISSGHPSAGVLLKTDDLLHFLKPKLVKISK